MTIQSEAALEAGLIATLQQMDYEYIQIAEEDNLQANFKRRGCRLKRQPPRIDK